METVLNHKCEHCACFDSAQEIIVPEKVRNSAKSKPFFIGLYTLPNWVGHSQFYIFKCKHCGFTSVDYPHGYTDFGLLFLTCQNRSCGRQLKLEPLEEEEIYRVTGGEMPSPSFEERKGKFEQMVKEGLGQKGIPTADQEIVHDIPFIDGLKLVVAGEKNFVRRFIESLKSLI